MPSRIKLRTALAHIAVLGLFAATPAWAADHGDAPLPASLGRTDAQITDLHVFTKGSNLVLALSVNPAVPPGSTASPFSKDLEVRFHIDRHTPVSFQDPAAVAKYGGTLKNEEGVSSDIDIVITFRYGLAELASDVNVSGESFGKFSACDKPVVSSSTPCLFRGLRDDPFIRRPRIGRNVGAIVVQLPLDRVRANAKSSTILVWATTSVPKFKGAILDHGGRALRSMFYEQAHPTGISMNTTTPAEHRTMLGVVPDVVIFNTAAPAKFPNGRGLEDDVVDLVVPESDEVDILAALRASDAPSPTTNDVPFLTKFPYLAPPQ